MQFSLDRAAEVLEGGWLPKSEAESGDVDTFQAVGEMQWRFQAFKTYKPGTKVLREISPKLGSTGVKGSFKALMHNRPAVKTSDSARRQAVWDNSFESDSFNFENKAKLVGLSDLAGLLVQAGFKEITDGEDLAEQLELDE